MEIKIDRDELYGAISRVQSIIENLRLTIQNNRDVILHEMRSFNDVALTPPLGTFYCLPDFRAYRQDSEALADFLLKKALVVSVPGKEFGMEGHLRLSFSGSIKEIREGLARMRWALDPEAPNEIYIGDPRRAAPENLKTVLRHPVTRK